MFFFYFINIQNDFNSILNFLYKSEILKMVLIYTFIITNLIHSIFLFLYKKLYKNHKIYMLKVIILIYFQIFLKM